LDIVVNFNTSLDENSEEIRDRKMMAIKYLKGNFTIDFLSALPIDLLASFFVKDLYSKQLKLF